MNYTLSHIPARSSKPREDGVTMVMDKVLSLRQAQDMVDASGHLIDLVKLGYATSFVTPNLKKKIELYQQADIKVYLGGTLFEAFVARGQFKEYRKLVGSLELDHSPYCGVTGTRVFPKDFSLELDDVGTMDVMAIMVTNQPFDYPAINKALAANAGQGLNAKLEAVLGGVLTSANSAQYQQGATFGAKAPASANALAIVIEVEKR